MESRSVSAATWATGFPSFILLQASQGSVLPDEQDIDRVFDFTHWTGSLGFGARLNEGFGASIRVGGTSRFDEKFNMFIAFDLGSLGSRDNIR